MNSTQSALLRLPIHPQIITTRQRHQLLSLPRRSVNGTTHEEGHSDTGKE